MWLYVFPGLSHELNLKKMRILTVMEIGVNKHEISFDELANQLGINVDDVEGFVIEGTIVMIYMG